jgi:hypothetical protein
LFLNRGPIQWRTLIEERFNEEHFSRKWCQACERKGPLVSTMYIHRHSTLWYLTGWPDWTNFWKLQNIQYYSMKPAFLSTFSMVKVMQ